MDFPKDLKYTAEHEWLRFGDNSSAVIGITAFAVEQLGDITMVELPQVGDKVAAGDTFGTIESVKSVSDLYAPLSGTVSRVNEKLEDEPELVNTSPYQDGWMVELTADNTSGDLLDEPAYAKLVAKEA